MMGFLWVALGGAIGSTARHGVNLWLGKPALKDFPWSTFTVNAAGCFLMGVVFAIAMERQALSSELRLFLMTGILGGFTTYSAFAMDFAVLVERKALSLAGAYAAATLAACLAGVFLGLAAGRAVTH